MPLLRVVPPPPPPPPAAAMALAAAAVVGCIVRRAMRRGPRRMPTAEIDRPRVWAVGRADDEFMPMAMFFGIVGLLNMCVAADC
jgi:hypothetical protein